MSTVKYFTPTTSKSVICSRGGLHESQPLNMVCLDKLCRDNPLSCSICFSQTHKYHKVVGLNKFIDDYHRNASDPNSKTLNKKINKHYGILKQSMQDFRNQINTQIDKFMDNLQKYVGYLGGHTKVRNQISNLTGLKLDPHQLQNLHNEQELQHSVRFILNNSLYDDNLNMINLAQILKQDQDKVYALLDKMVYMTQHSQRVISQAVSSLNFAEITLKAEKAQFNNDLERIWKSKPDPLNTSHFNKEKIKLGKLITTKTDLIIEEQQKPNSDVEFPSSGDLSYKFSKYRHSMLTLKDQGTTVVSNITALKPQFALMWPNLNCQPQKTQQWSIRINNCRNFASANTMGLGIGKLSDLKLANFEDDPTNVLVVTSQGYVINKDEREKTDFIYGKGDVLHFKYDPFYGILEVKKQNGRKLTLKALQNNTQPVYICARLTYASDQVQIV